MIHSGVKSIISAPAAHYIERTFRELKTRPEDIFRMIPACEKHSIPFVFKFFGKPIPPISIEYLAKEEVEPAHRENYGMADKDGIKILVDNVFRRIVNHAHPLEVQFSNFLAHEGVHVHDGIHTTLHFKQNEIIGELKGMGKPPPRLCFWLPTDTRRAELYDRLFALDSLVEGRAARLEMLSMSAQLGNTPASEADAMFYVRQLNAWHYDSARAMQLLEGEFGFEAWRLSVEIPPKSYAEMMEPPLYAARIRGARGF